MSQTIDQLLTDVSPLLPVSRDKDNGMHKTRDGQLAYLLVDDRYNNLTEYMRHAANHFPAMLEALRIAANVIEKANLGLLRVGLFPYEDAEQYAKQAIAAASEVGE